MLYYFKYLARTIYWRRYNKSSREPARYCLKEMAHGEIPFSRREYRLTYKYKYQWARSPNGVYNTWNETSQFTCLLVF